jgi:hypothetical protein
MRTPVQSPVFGWLLCALLAGAQAQPIEPRGPRPAMEAPVVGRMIDAQGALRTVSGLAGNFLAGPEQAHGVAALACSDQVCVTAPDPSVLAIDGKRAASYVPQNGAFVTWTVGGRALAPEPLPWNPLQSGDTVLSIRLTPEGGDIAVRRGGAIWIVSQDGGVLDALPPEADGPVLLVAEGVIYARQDGVILRRPDGTESSFPAPGVTALFAMSPGWVEAAAGGSLYALRTSAGREGLYVLPANAAPGDPQ